MKIGIIGIGMVGENLKKWFETAEFQPVCYDKYKEIGSMEFINKTKIVFICVPTPYDKKNKNSNLKIVEEVILEITGEKIIVIKSTILPGTTNYLQDKYPQHKFLHNPEFLTEATAEFDMFNPDIQIVGCTERSKSVARVILDILPKAPYREIVRAKESEFLKYFCNIFFSMKVTFINQMYNVCDKWEVDYNVIKKLATQNSMIAPTHLDVWHKGKRGYNGKCLPKDIKSFIRFANEIHADVRLLECADDINDELLEGQGLKDDY